VLVEDLLDLARVHVVAAADDHVLLAVDDEEVAVLVDARHVAEWNQPSLIASAVASSRFQ
jgi:hypothetical protein